MVNKILVAVIIIVVIVFIGFLISNLEVVDIEEENFDEQVSLAENWIYENSLTFNERGGSELEYVRTVEIEEGVYEITFNFVSSFAGYGAVGEDEMTAQVVTPHVVVVVIEGDEVKSVVIDGNFSEIAPDEEESREVDLYFIIVEDNEEKITTVKRFLSLDDELEKNTLLQLLLGPTSEEEVEGYTTAINKGVEINEFYIEEKVAYVDFTEELNVSGGSALVTMIRDQIEKTLLQFETVETVEISIEDEKEEILQP
jgi:spore germination protein GerM